MMEYPSHLERWWIRQLLEDECLMVDGRDEPASLSGRLLGRLTDRVDRMSQSFTKEREESFGDYARDRRMLFAYGLFFFPQTYERTRMVCHEALRRVPSERGKVLRVLDLGAGTGAAGLAAVASLAEQYPGTTIELDAVDSSRNALTLIEFLVRDCGAAVGSPVLRIFERELKADTAPEAPRAVKYDVIVISFALNEIFHAAPAGALLPWMREWLSRLTPNGMLLVMEPSLRECSIRLETLRDELITAGHGIVAPCLHAQPCPLLKAGKFWCHEVRAWRRPESMHLINRQLRRSVETTLKFSFLAITQAPVSGVKPDAARFRTISPVGKGKATFFVTGCNALGEAAHYEIQRRDLDIPTRKAFEDVERGSVMTLQDWKPLGSPAQYRIANGHAYTVEGEEKVS